MGCGKSMKITCEADGSALLESCTIIHSAGFGSGGLCASYSLLSEQTNTITITNLGVVDAVVPWRLYDFVMWCSGKFGNAGCQFLRTEGAWQGFSNEPSVRTSSQVLQRFIVALACCHPTICQPSPEMTELHETS